jgi:hypothetical protein
MNRIWQRWIEEIQPLKNDEQIIWHQKPHIYHRGLQVTDRKYPGFLTVNPAEWYTQPGSGREVWHTPEGELGYSLLPSPEIPNRREIAGLYAFGTHRGKGKHAARRAFSQGGNFLQAFEGRRGEFSLPIYYHQHVGAQPIGYMPFDRSLAHPQWNYEKFGEPGLVQLEIPPEAHRDVDRWLRMDHTESNQEFRDRLRFLKKKAGVPVNEGRKHQHCDEALTDEEMRQMAAATDDFLADVDPEDWRNIPPVSKH